MIAYFDADGLVVGISSGTMGLPPGTEYMADVPEGTDPNSIYFDDGAVKERQPFPIAVNHGGITGIPDGTVARVAGRPQPDVEDGVLTLEADEAGTRWVRLTHPHYLDWAGNVAVGPQP